MMCCYCGKGIGDRTSLVPIDPKGVKNRRWTCLECTKLNGIEVPTKVKEISSLFDEKFNEIVK